MSPDVRLQVESPYKRDAFASKSSRVTLQGDEYNANQKSSIADILATAENSAAKEATRTKQSSGLMNLEAVPEERLPADGSSRTAGGGYRHSIGQGSKQSGSMSRPSKSKVEMYMRKPIKGTENKKTFRDLARRKTVNFKHYQSNINSLVSLSLPQGMQFIKFMKELSIDHKGLPKDLAQQLFKRVDEIERINNDDILSQSLQDLKVNLNRAQVESTHKSYIKTTRERDLQRIQDAVSGVRHKKFISDINSQKKVEEGRKVQFRLVQTTGKFFYEVEYSIMSEK